MRVLAIDDQYVNLVLVLRQMERLGIPVDLAEDPREGLRRATTEQYTLILVDCAMPVLDGFELTRRLRAHEKTSGHRAIIVALSAGDPDEERERCIAAGMDDFVPKPASLDALRLIIERWLPTGVTMEAAKSGAHAATDRFAPVDWAMLGAVIGTTDRAEALAMIALYRDTTRPIMEDLDKAIATQDRDRLRHAAHRAKGSSANIAATELAAILGQIERDAGTGPLEELAELVTAARTRFAEVAALVT